MRKLILAMAVIALSTVSAQAQTSFGLKAGMTSANLKASGGGVSISMTSKIGFYAGAFAEVGVSETFAVQPELFYSLLGAKGGDDEDAGKIDISYINLPIFAKYKKDGLSIFLGPQISYLLSAKSKGDGSSSEDIKDQLKSTDISGVLGAGYTLTNGFGFDARYQLGLTDIAKDNDGEGSLKNNAFMIGIHYRFNK